MRRAAPFLVIALILALPALNAVGALTPLNDLLALGQGIGQKPAKVAIATRAEPPFVATPRAQCGPGSKPEPGIQGRVPAGSATQQPALQRLADRAPGHLRRLQDVPLHRPGRPRVRVLRHRAAVPGQRAQARHQLAGVAVLDMSNPAKPVQTATLTEIPMLSPHESLNLNPKRGLLAAVTGNPSTYPGLVSIYDVSKDCRHPVLQSTSAVARLGHESGFSPDGKTFYATGTARESITAVDVTNPKEPHAVWQGNVVSHGMTLSDDGNRAYVADVGGNMLILDVSQIQARKPNPQAREVSRLTWHAASIPQNAIPFTDHGHPYVLEFDEYTQGTTGVGDSNMVGAARIIDIADEKAPRVVANLRLQVNQPADHKAASADPGAGSPVQGYAAHYCSLSSQVDPTVVACSFIASGLRVFDISDLLHPKEIAYYVAPTQPRAENEFMASDFAMSKPVIVPARREVWYTDGATGFYALRVAESAWPGEDAGAGGAGKKGCLSVGRRIRHQGIGKVRLGMTRKALLRRLPAPRHKKKRAWRWCVRGGGKVTAAFTKRGRVALVSTTARVPLKRARLRAFRHPRSLGHGLVRPFRGSHRLFTVRRGKVRVVSIASSRTIKQRALLRRYLRAASSA